MIRHLRRCGALIALLLLLAQPSRAENITQTIVEATCTEPGYIVTHDADAETSVVENLPALGHAFSDWTADETAGVKNRACAACGLSETVRISTIDEALMPRLYLTGSMDGIGKKLKVALEAQFVSPEQSFECYAITTLQGHSTYGYPKHNYTVRFYDDDQSIAKHKLTFKNWNAEHKYILKANYYDLSQCRNLVGARLWTAMTASRSNLSPRIASLPLLGAVDGFPVEVWLNGEYFGLYTMNLHKDDDLYRMKDGEKAALAICNQQTTDESLFRARAEFSPDYTSDWEIEYCGTEDEAWAKDSFNALIDFVMQSSDEEFRADLHRHLDVDAAIDYLIFIYSLGLENSGAKDLVMLNYGGAWIPSAYDMDEAFGLIPGSSVCRSAGDFLPQRTDGAWDSGTKSLLWDRLLTAFEPEIRARYAELREGALSEESVLGLVDDFIGSVPEACYDMDKNLHPDRPMTDTDMHAQINDYITARFAVLDTILEVHEQ